MHISTIRRRADRVGLRVWKVRESSRYFWEYGPFAVIDASTSGIFAKGLTLEEVAEFVRSYESNG